ncbi:hypothetical protein ACLKA7_001742 [Drosophila subpalustris]
MAPANLETALPSSAPAVLQTVRKPRSRPDAIIIEPKEKLTYSEILNLVNRSQDDKLKSVGESVHRTRLEVLDLDEMVTLEDQCQEIR